MFFNTVATLLHVILFAVVPFGLAIAITLHILKTPSIIEFQIYSYRNAKRDRNLIGIIKSYL